MQRALPKDPSRWTFGEFTEWAELQERPFELVNGLPVAMVGARLSHNIIVGNLSAALDSAVRPRGCRVFSQGMLLKAGENLRAPDVFVNCDKTGLDPDSRHLETAVLITEVLSPTTQAEDRGPKWHDYQQVPSLELYILVSATRRNVETYRRRAKGEWLFATVGAADTLQIEIVEHRLILDLDELYEGSGI